MDCKAYKYYRVYITKNGGASYAVDGSTCRDAGASKYRPTITFMNNAKGNLTRDCGLSGSVKTSGASTECSNNVCGRCSASACGTGQGCADCAFQGCTETIWTTYRTGNHIPAWLKFTFDKPTVVSKYAVEATGNPVVAIVDWSLQASNDNVVWETLDSQASQNTVCQNEKQPNSYQVNCTDFTDFKCPQGYYGQTQCEPHTLCSPGTSFVAPGNASADTQCSACGPESYSAVFNQTDCEPHTLCAPGTHFVAPGNATADTQCSACGAGLYSAVFNQTDCEPHTLCSPGTHVVAPGNATTDTQCSACNPGFYSAVFNQTQCIPHTLCLPGTFIEMLGNASSDRSCAPCVNGTFTAIVNQNACTEWTVCAPGETESKTGSPSKDRECQLKSTTTQSTLITSTVATATTGVPLEGLQKTTTVSPTQGFTTTEMLSLSSLPSSTTTVSSTQGFTTTAIKKASPLQTTTGLPQRRATRYPSGDPLDLREDELSSAPSSCETKPVVILVLCLPVFWFGLRG